MPAVIINIKREDLFREISDILHKWPDLERSVFEQAHYYGQSPKSISHSFKMDEEKVRSILRQCDSKLHASLRKYRTQDICKPPMIIPAAASPNVCEQKA